MCGRLHMSIRYRFFRSLLHKSYLEAMRCPNIQNYVPLYQPYPPTEVPLADRLVPPQANYLLPQTTFPSSVLYFSTEYLFIFLFYTNSPTILKSDVHFLGCLR